SNAVRYSGGDSHPRIVVGLRRDAEDAVIEVRDFGIGVSNDDQNNIFEPFNRSTNDDIQAKGGTGLGLAIVREVARGHGGDVSVESKLGEGSVFRLRLPIPDEVKEEVVEVENGAYLGYRRRA
ncbi:MAG TPA: ATP-binding protein, partial [Pyrinomonadaceae bacterium]|nr:ATP-binding protein [Pyrinomonadaceae bacterium]